MEGQFYRQVWEAEKALKAAVPTAWLVRGGVAFAVVKFPRVAEPGEWWAEKAWIAVPWIFGNGFFGVEVVFEDAKFTAVACPQHGERLAEVEVHILLNTEPVVGFGYTTRRCSGSKAGHLRFTTRPSSGRPLRRLGA